MLNRKFNPGAPGQTRKYRKAAPPRRKAVMNHRTPRRAFTLVEVMIAATISLVLVGLVVQIFATVGATASQTRAVVQMTDRLRSARIVMQQDLSNITAEMLPPLKTDRAAGYFEYIEGPDGPIFPGMGASPIPIALDINQTTTTGTPTLDSTVGDPDDVLMFTAQAPTGTSFYGRARAASTVVDPTGRQWTMPVDTMAQASQAEIIYFMRGNTLYRRVLLVMSASNWPNSQIDPSIFLWSQYTNYIGVNPIAPPAPLVIQAQPVWDIAFYDKFDVSVHQQGGAFDFSSSTGGAQTATLVPNTLGDLTRRQNRYAHQPWVYPFDVRFWDTRFWTNPASNVAGGFLGLPTMRENTAYLGSQNANSGTAIWPLPLYDNPNNPAGPITLWNGVVFQGSTSGAASQNLWGSQQPSGSNIWPYSQLPLIYPYPTAGNAATYQPNTLIPATATGRVSLTANKGGVFDLWENPYPLDQQDPVTGAIYAFSSAYQPANWVNVNFSTRYADDVLLTHVLSFDVKAWDPTAPTIQTDQTFGGIPPGTYMPGDPGYVNIFNAWSTSGVPTLRQYLQPKQLTPTQPPGPYGGYGYVVAQGAYVDLNYLGPIIQVNLGAPPPNMAQALAQVSVFAGPGIAQFGSSFAAGSGLGMLYDTGCFDYENDGIDQNQNGIIDEFTNGIDDNGIGGVDDLTEVEGPTPYPVPLKGIQIKLRVFDPDSRQIREVTLTQDFLWE
jgi:hypothetical protein